MNVRRYEIYFECWPGYLTSEQSEWDISCSTREIISYFKTSMYCSVYYIKIVLLPHKNRAVYSNAFHDNLHMWDYHE